MNNKQLEQKASAFELELQSDYLKKKKYWLWIKNKIKQLTEYNLLRKKWSEKLFILLQFCTKFSEL